MPVRREGLPAVAEPYSIRRLGPTRGPGPRPSGPSDAESPADRARWFVQGGVVTRQTEGMDMTRVGLTLLILLGTGGAPGEARAQRLSLAPEIGIYIPTEKLVDATNGTVGEMEAGLSLGARLGLRFGDRIGIHVSGAYVPTTFALDPAGGEPERHDARLFNGTGQAVVFLLPPQSMLSVFLNGGIGVVSRGGVAFTGAAETTNVTGVAGAGATVRLGRIALSAGAELFAYKASYEAGGVSSSELSQRDIQIRLGLGFPLRGGGMVGKRP